MTPDPLADVFCILEGKGVLTAERRAVLTSAYAIADRAHAGCRRKSGDPYITHPVAVAEIVAAWPFLSRWFRRPSFTT